MTITELIRRLTLGYGATVGIVVLVSVIAVLWMDNNNKDTELELNNLRLASIVAAYKQKYAAQIQAFAQTPTVIDYFRSGESTRNQMKPAIDNQIAGLSLEGTTGIQIYTKYNDLIYESGKTTAKAVSFDLCYLNRDLDTEYGICHTKIKAFISEIDFVASLTNTSDLVQHCPSCDYTFFESQEIIGNVLVTHGTSLSLPINFNAPDDLSHVKLGGLIILFGLLGGSVLQRRTSSAIKNNFATPLKEISAAVHSPNKIEPKSYSLEEVSSLRETLVHWQTVVQQSEQLKIYAEVGEVAAQVAHDIRSPLAAIHMSLQKTSVDEGIRNAVNRLERIAEDLLATYRSENRAPKKCSVWDATKLLQSIIHEKTTCNVLQNRRINLQLEEPSGAFFIQADEIAIGRALSNILDNAIEATTPDGEIQVLLSERDTKAIITISDNGTGIPANILERLGEESLTTKKTGSGIGFLQAKTSVESYNGLFSIASKVGQGTSITIEFDLIRPVKIDAAEASIALVEDDPFVSEAWRNSLQVKGYDLQCLSTVDSAKATLNRLPKEALIFVDLYLGEDKGVDLIDWLSSEGFKYLYIASGIEPNESLASSVRCSVGKTPPDWL